MIEVKPFDPLDREVDVFRSYLLEASAGTGKTFSIENVVVRLLIDGEEPPALEEILVVTFTRAATRELRSRIRQRIQLSVRQLGGGEDLPDHLQAVVEKGAAAIVAARRRLERALACYDDAQIFTIHGFCTRMLAEYGFEAEVVDSGDGELSVLRMLQVVTDTLRTDVTHEAYSPAQLKILLSKYLYNDKTLARALLRIVKQNIKIAAGQPWTASHTLFWQALLDIKGQFGNPSAEAICHDFALLAPLYKGACRRDGTMKPEIEQAVERFAKLFELETLSADAFDDVLTSGLVAAEALSPEARKVRAKEPDPASMQVPGIFEVIEQQLLPLVEEARSHPALLARLAFDCKKRLDTLKQEEELMGPDDILEAMAAAVDRGPFREAVSRRYRCGIVDEFQDTDPLQWRIFRGLFVDREIPVYLVGDPKQSIYAFRNADVYTYLDAAETLGEERHRTLDTNYRSQASLVFALNHLFERADAGGLIALPRVEKTLPFQPVQAGGRVDPVTFHDGAGVVRFLLAEGKRGRGAAWPTPALEEENFLPAIADAIAQMHRDDALPLTSFAVLVRDRYQGERVLQFLSGRGIACSFKRTLALVDTSAFQSVHLALAATLAPTDLSAVKTALGTPLMGWTETRLSSIGEDEHSVAAASLVAHFQQLQQVLTEGGCAAWYQALLWSEMVEELIPAERLAAEQEGAQFLDEVTQVAQRLVDFQSRTGARGDGLFQAFREMNEWADNEDDRVKVQSDTGQDAVTLMTMHASKGLEFDVVFALGLVNRTPGGDGLVRMREAGGDILTRKQAVDCPHAAAYNHEIDAEKMRQLYVAMTRAKLRLFLPVAIEAGCKEPPEAGTASPMELFLARILDPSNDPYVAIRRIQSADVEAWIAEQEPTLGIDVAQSGDGQIVEKAPEERPKLVPPTAIAVPGQHRYVVSFSALARRLVSEKQQVEHPEDTAYTVHHLPAGSETGNLVHGVFESIAWPQLDNLHSPEDLWGAIAATPYGTVIESQWHSWREPLLQLFFDALTVKLDGQFCLAEVPPNKQFREMEFLHPWKHPVPEFELHDGYLKGFIDLLFERNGKYYLLDWKTNRLGVDGAAYSPDRLADAMASHHYTLQAKIYAQALKRYLAVIDSRPFEEVFGGAYYLFLRGLGEGGGVAFLSPEQALVPLTELEG